MDVSDWAHLPSLCLYMRHGGRGFVTLRADLEHRSNERLRRVVLAHELAHHVLHVGVYTNPFHCRRDERATSHVEAQAERWAAERLCPIPLVREALAQWGRIGQEEATDVADVARVPDAFVVWWLSDLKRRGELLAPRLRWASGRNADGAIAPIHHWRDIAIDQPIWGYGTIRYGMAVPRYRWIPRAISHDESRGKCPMDSSVLSARAIHLSTAGCPTSRFGAYES